MGKHLGAELRSLIIEAARRGLVTVEELDAHCQRLDAAETPAEKMAEARRFMAEVTRRSEERYGPAEATRPVVPSTN